jgi:periplasmic divalent cation tolerance protein
MLFIYITCANKKEAERIARALLNGRLTACANIWPIEAVYKWKGKIEKCREVVLLVKTLKKNYKKIEKMVKKLHSYEIPIIARIDVSKVNRDYLNWTDKELR